MFGIRRREFITLLGGAAASWPLAARAQQGDRLRRIGVLMSYAKSDPDGGGFVAAFRERLQQLGWLEGRDIRIDDRWAALDAEALQRFAKELIALQPDLILSQTTNSTAALLQQSRTVPIIFANVADPVGSGFVASLARPGAASPDSSCPSRRWRASGWSCSRRSRRASNVPLSCSILQPRPLPNISWNPLRPPLYPREWRRSRRRFTTSPTSKPSSLLTRASPTVA